MNELRIRISNKMKDKLNWFEGNHLEFIIFGFLPKINNQYFIKENTTFFTFLIN